MALPVTRETPVQTRVRLDKACWAFKLQPGVMGTITEVRDNGVVVKWDNEQLMKLAWVHVELISIVPPWEFQNEQSFKTLDKVHAAFRKYFG